MQIYTHKLHAAYLRPAIHQSRDFYGACLGISEVRTSREDSRRMMYIYIYIYLRRRNEATAGSRWHHCFSPLTSWPKGHARVPHAACGNSPYARPADVARSYGSSGPSYLSSETHTDTDNVGCVSLNGADEAYFTIRARPRSPAGLRGFISPRSPSCNPPPTPGRRRRRRPKMRTAQTHNYSPRARIEEWGLLAEGAVLLSSSFSPTFHPSFSAFLSLSISLCTSGITIEIPMTAYVVLSESYLHLKEVIRTFHPSVLYPLSSSVFYLILIVVKLC